MRIFMEFCSPRLVALSEAEILLLIAELIIVN
jgi:hypothetical protein